MWLGLNDQRTPVVELHDHIRRVLARLPINDVRDRDRLLLVPDDPLIRVKLTQDEQLKFGLKLHQPVKLVAPKHTDFGPVHAGRGRCTLNASRPESFAESDGQITCAMIRSTACLVASARSPAVSAPPPVAAPETDVDHVLARNSVRFGNVQASPREQQHCLENSQILVAPPRSACAHARSAHRSGSSAQHLVDSGELVRARVTRAFHRTD